MEFRELSNLTIILMAYQDHSFICFCLILLKSPFPLFSLPVERLVRQWAPLVWLAPGEKFMPSSVTDFLHHVHAEKSKTPVKNKPSAAGNESGSAEDDDDDDGADRDNEHELYLLHQHQQQLSERLTAQLLRQRQQQLRPAANRRNADAETAESGGNPWERRNKRTYHDENLLMDYIIDMPVGENSENWNLVTNDDIGKAIWEGSCVGGSGF